MERNSSNNNTNLDYIHQKNIKHIVLQLRKEKPDIKRYCKEFFDELQRRLAKFMVENRKDLEQVANNSKDKENTLFFLTLKVAEKICDKMAVEFRNTLCDSDVKNADGALYDIANNDKDYNSDDNRNDKDNKKFGGNRDKNSNFNQNDYNNRLNNQNDYNNRLNNQNNNNNLGQNNNPYNNQGFNSNNRNLDHHRRLDY